MTLTPKSRAARIASRAAKSIQKIRAARRAKGLCRDCGQDSGGRYRCETCREKAAQWQRERYQTQTNQADRKA